MRFLRLFLCLLFTLFCGAQASAMDHAPDFTRAPIEIRHADGSVSVFDVEWALTSAQQSYGLMYRKALKPDQGMIFPFDPPRIVSFWMKNTYLSLDLVFFGPDRTISEIKASAKPLDETLLTSLKPTSFVLEIPAGRAAQTHMQVGDQLQISKK